MSEPKPSYHNNPTEPKLKLPAGSCDSHFHVFGPKAKFPFAKDAAYLPADAPKDVLIDRHMFLGIVGPANLPVPVVSRLNEAIRASLAGADTKEKMSKLGAITEGGSTPAEFRAFLVKDLERWERVIKTAGVKAGD